MKVTVGTFNLNNLFSRFNFKGAIDELKNSESVTGVTYKYEFTDPNSYRIRTFMGKLIKEKDKDATEKVAQRIISMNTDVLAVQEVEDIDILRQFNRENLKGLYSYCVLIEGNDPRFIDVGLLSKLPIGAATSHQTAVHPDNPNEPVFGRDLLEVEILSADRKNRLFTMFINHLKSHFGDEDDHGNGKVKNDKRRSQQAQMVQAIVSARMNKRGKYIILGDMNDPPDSAFLEPMQEIENIPLHNALINPIETRPPKTEATGPGPQTTAWTYRHKPSGEPPQYILYDQIWLSEALAPALRAATIDRRTLHKGDGSDHDPAWIELDL